MLVKYTVSEFLSAKGSFSSIDIGFYFISFNDRILGPLKDKAKLFKHEI